MSKQPKESFECPNCGATVVVGKRACRECGSDASTGWQSSEEIDYQSIDIPDGYGPDDELAEPSRSARLMPIIALVMAIVLALAWMRWY